MYRYILTFSDYIEYLIWHYDLDIDRIFTSIFELIHDQMINHPAASTLWKLSVSTKPNSRNIILTDEYLELPVKKERPPQHTREILQQFNQQRILSTESLVKYTHLTIVSDPIVHKSYITAANDLLSHYNALRNISKNEQSLEAIKTQLLQLHSTIKRDNSIDPIKKTLLCRPIVRGVSRITYANRRSPGTADIRQYAIEQVTTVQTHPKTYTLSDTVRHFVVGPYLANEKKNVIFSVKTHHKKTP